MPELPEMENYRLLLSNKMIGRQITAAAVERVKSINMEPERFIGLVSGQTVLRLERRAKHLLFHLSNHMVLVLHLMLGGLMFYGREEDKPDRTVQVTLYFGLERLYFIGLRLGWLHLYTALEAEQVLSKLGTDPFSSELTHDRFAELLQSKSGALKSVLTDQSVISGIGGCYSDEICFQAALLPARKARQLSSAELDRLYRAMHEVLREATARGGYMEMPLFAGDTLTGGFNELCRVYDREGEPCVRCGSPIERRDAASKKSFCCPHCQS